jgi:hypothetical protein
MLISSTTTTHTHKHSYTHTHRLAVDAVLRLKGSGNLDYIQVIALTESSDPMLFHVLLVLIFSLASFTLTRSSSSHAHSHSQNLNSIPLSLPCLLIPSLSVLFPVSFPSLSYLYFLPLLLTPIHTTSSLSLSPFSFPSLSCV